MNRERPTLDLVIPVYNEEAILDQSIPALSELIASLITKGVIGERSGLLLVDDGSRDRSWEMLSDWSRKDPRVRAVRLARNFGHQNALIAGMDASQADCLITIDADLQDDLRCIEAMVEHFRKGCEVVYGVRSERRSDGLWKRSSAEFFYSLMRKMGVPIVYNHADYRLLSARAVHALKEYREVNLFLRGLVPSVGLKSETVLYSRLPRTAGETKYPLRKMLEFALQGVTSFSTFPLRLIAIAGLFAFVLTIALTLWAFFIKFYTSGAIPGWASTVLPIYFLGGVQLLALGVIGEYVGKIYLETKQRPRYLIAESVGGITPTMSTH